MEPGDGARVGKIRMIKEKRKMRSRLNICTQIFREREKEIWEVYKRGGEIRGFLGGDEEKRRKDDKNMNEKIDGGDKFEQKQKRKKVRKREDSRG